MRIHPEGTKMKIRIDTDFLFLILGQSIDKQAKNEANKKRNSVDHLDFARASRMGLNGPNLCCSSVNSSENGPNG